MYITCHFHHKQFCANGMYDLKSLEMELFVMYLFFQFKIMVMQIPFDQRSILLCDVPIVITLLLCDVHIVITLCPSAHHRLSPLSFHISA